MLRMLRRVATSRPGMAAAGAACMYFLDPDRGRSRRTRATSQLCGAARHARHRACAAAMRREHFWEGRARGLAARARGQGHYHPKSEVDLREHVRQVIRSLPVATGDVTVEVAGAKATLRGQVASDHDRGQLVAAAAGVPGIEHVEDFLHLPGTEAPNKAMVLHIPA